METLLKYSPILPAIIPIFLFMWYVISKFFNHEHRIKNNEFRIKDNAEEVKILKNLGIQEKFSDHHRRIKTLEEDKKIFIEKVDAVLQSTARIEGVLKSKKDKE